jgi:superfamily II DNA/RNA helicase
MAAETGSGKTGAFCLPILQIVWETLKDLQSGKESGVAAQVQQCVYQILAIANLIKEDMNILLSSSRTLGTEFIRSRTSLGSNARCSEMSKQRAKRMAWLSCQ